MLQTKDSSSDNVTIVKVLERLRTVLDVKTNYKLSKLLEINPGNISVWKKRDTIPFKLLTSVCDKHSINYNYIIYGEGYPHMPGSFDVPKADGLIPVVGLAEAGPGDGGHPPGVSDTYLSRPAGLKDPKAFGVRIEGDSMRPAFKPGQIVIVSPKLECQNGDVVVANLKNHGHILGEIIISSEKATLTKYNADDIVFSLKELIWCYPVVWHKRR